MPEGISLDRNGRNGSEYIPGNTTVKINEIAT